MENFSSSFSVLLPHSHSSFFCCSSDSAGVCGRQTVDDDDDDYDGGGGGVLQTLSSDSRTRLCVCAFTH